MKDQPARYRLIIEGTKDEIEMVQSACEISGRIYLHQFDCVLRLLQTPFWNRLSEPNVIMARGALANVSALMQQAQNLLTLLPPEVLTYWRGLTIRDSNYYYSLWKGIPVAMALCMDEKTPDDFGVAPGRVTVEKIRNDG
jgi:hypothetical protein